MKLPKFPIKGLEFSNPIRFTIIPRDKIKEIKIPNKEKKYLKNILIEFLNFRFDFNIYTYL